MTVQKPGEYSNQESGVYAVTFSEMKDKPKSIKGHQYETAFIKFKLDGKDATVTLSADCYPFGLGHYVWQLTKVDIGNTCGEQAFSLAQKALSGCKWSGLVRVGPSGFADQLQARPGQIYRWRFSRFTTRDPASGLVIHQTKKEPNADGTYNHFAFWEAELIDPPYAGWLHRQYVKVATKFVEEGNLYENSALYPLVAACGVTPDDFNAVFFSGSNRYDPSNPLAALEEMLIERAGAGHIAQAVMGKSGMLDYNIETMLALAEKVKPASRPSRVLTDAPQSGDALVPLVEVVMGTMYGSDKKMVGADGKATPEGLYFYRHCIKVIADALPGSGIMASWPPEHGDPKRRWTAVGISLADKLLGDLAAMDNERLMMLIGESDKSHAALAEWAKVAQAKLLSSAASGTGFDDSMPF